MAKDQKFLVGGARQPYALAMENEMAQHGGSVPVTGEPVRKRLPKRTQLPVRQHHAGHRTKCGAIVSGRVFATFDCQTRHAGVDELLDNLLCLRLSPRFLKGDQQWVVAKGFGNAIGIKIAQKIAFDFGTAMYSFASFQHCEGCTHNCQLLDPLARDVTKRSNKLRPKWAKQPPRFPIRPSAHCAARADCSLTEGTPIGKFLGQQRRLARPVDVLDGQQNWTIGRAKRNCVKSRPSLELRLELTEGCFDRVLDGES